MSFAENFNAICKSKGTTPTGILKKLEVSTSKVAAWNKGALPKEEMLYRLANELGCSVRDFFDDRQEWEKVKTYSPQDDDEKDIYDLFRSMNRKERHEFMAMVYDFGEKIKTKDATAGTSTIAG